MTTLLSRLLMLGMTALLALTTLACDTASTANATDATADAALATEDEPGDDRPVEPGRLWRVAAAVQDTLSDAQFTRIEDRLRTLSGRFSERSGPRDDSPRLRRPGMGRRALSVLADLDLTEEQKDALKDLRAAYRPQIRTLIRQRRDGTITPEDVRAQMQTLRAEMRGNMRSILTEAQRTLLAERRAERRARREAARAVRAEVLGLTAAQEEQLAALRTDPDARPRLVEDYDAWKASFAEILTEEQVEITIVHAALRAKVRAERVQNRRPGRDGNGPRGGRFGG